VLGTAFFKVAWSDGAREVRFPEGIVSEGDVCMTVCSPYEIFPDNLDAESMEECRSLIHAKAVHIDEIWQRYNVAVSPDAADGMPKNHALVLERYEKPSAGLPDGRLLIAAGGKLLYNGILPYKNGNDGARTIPIIRQTSSKQPGKFFGTSVLERSIPVQRAYNAVKNRKHEFLNRLASGVLAVEDGSVDSDELMEEGLMPGKILSYRQGSAPPAFLNPGHLPGDLTYEEDRLLSEFVTISGVSEVMRSSQTPRNIASGIALQILIEQDESRLNITAEAIRAAIQETAKQTLRLYKQFAGEKRLERLVGENGEIEIFYFSGSDISSDDVVFNTDSQISETPAQKRSFVMELMRSGLLTDENGKLSNRMRLRILEMLGFGAWENSQDIQALHQQRAMSENISLAFELLPDIDDHELHEAEHTKYFLSTEFKRAAERVPAMRGILHAHIKEHKEYKA
ncbi:MAG: hypothetical protein FWE62_06885, partial [Firmicutes bacterium]|nr:hypothetical protein [Bacillota bacterium]